MKQILFLSLLMLVLFSSCSREQYSTSLSTKAQKKIAKGDTLKAVKLYLKALELDYENLQALQSYGRILENTTSTKETLDEYWGFLSLNYDTSLQELKDFTASTLIEKSTEITDEPKRIDYAFSIYKTWKQSLGIEQILHQVIKTPQLLQVDSKSEYRAFVTVIDSVIDYYSPLYSGEDFKQAALAEIGKSRASRLQTLVEFDSISAAEYQLKNTITTISSAMGQDSWEDSYNAMYNKTWEPSYYNVALKRFLHEEIENSIDTLLSYEINIPENWNSYKREVVQKGDFPNANSYHSDMEGIVSMAIDTKTLKGRIPASLKLSWSVGNSPITDSSMQWCAKESKGNDSQTITNKIIRANAFSDSIGFVEYELPSPKEPLYISTLLLHDGPFTLNCTFSSTKKLRRSYSHIWDNPMTFVKSLHATE